MSKTAQEYLDKLLVNLATDYCILESLKPNSKAILVMQGIEYLTTTAYLEYEKVSFNDFKVACDTAGYPILTGSDRRNMSFGVPYKKVLELCAREGKAPKFDKYVNNSGDLDWKPRESQRLTGPERAYIMVHQDEYNLDFKSYRVKITPKAMPEGLRSKDATKAARSVAISSFNKNMYPWIVLALNLQPLPENGSITCPRTWVTGFDYRAEILDMRGLALKGVRESRKLQKEIQEYEYKCRKINAFFKQHKGKTHLELKDIIISKCVDKIFCDVPKYMNIHPYSAVAKALSK